MGAKKCKKCEKIFASQKALSGHMKVHSLKVKKNKQSSNKEKRLSTIYQYAICTTNDPLSICTPSFDNAEQIEEETAAAMGLMMLPNGFANSGGDEMVISTLAKFNDTVSVHDMDLGKENLSVVERGNKKMVFKCAVCFKEFVSAKSLGGHKRVHRYKCLVCLEVFGSGEDLEDHKRAHCKVYKCSICFEEFGSERFLGDHYRARCKKKIQGGHKCKICFKVFASGSALGGHMSFHTKVMISSKGYKCSDCSKIFGSGEDLEDHKRVSCNVIRNSSEVHKCKICFMEFGSGPSLGGHMKTHSKEFVERARCNVLRNSEVHKCKICFKEFGSGQSLGGHMRTHSNVITGMNLKRSVRFNELVTVEDLEGHKKACCNVLATSSKVCKCSVCFKEFGSRKSLGSHMRVHYKCTLCFTRFKSEKALEAHMNLHSNAITSSKDHYYKCSVCSMEFGTGEDLEDHNRAAHCNGITSSKEFGPGPSLGGHTRIHSNVITNMDRKCSVCSKESGSGLSLWGHMSVHSSAMRGSNDHLCFLCFMKFGSVEALEDHERVHHSAITSKDYKCSVCFKEFWSEEALRVHMNGHVDHLRETENKYWRWISTMQWYGTEPLFLC